jgi:protein translocase SecG subunit
MTTSVFLLGLTFLIICFLLIMAVLLQKGRGGGLGAAFGGGATSAFGTRTGDVMTWVTIILTGLFLSLAIVTSLVARPDIGMVENPTVNYEGAVDAEGRGITLSCATKGATIRFTTSGDDPTENSRAYNQKASNQRTAVLVKPGTILKLRAFRSGVGASDIVEFVYTDQAAEVPEAPKTPEVPAVPEALKAPAVPAVPEAPKAPKAPKTPKTPKAPEAPAVPATK